MLHNLADPVSRCILWQGSVGLDTTASAWTDQTRGLFAIIVAYPLIPWVGVMAAGYCLGPVFLWEPERRQRFLLKLGLGLTAAFVIVRAVNIYGDPVRGLCSHPHS